MPMDRAKYPADWEAISKAIRETAGQRCEFCGVANGAIGSRDSAGTFHPAINADGGLELWGKQIKIVLTVAHLDHDTTNNDRSNLRALCQRCHLVYDKDLHAKNAAATRARKQAEAAREIGQQEMSL